jgi:hypothetical protein
VLGESSGTDGETDSLKSGEADKLGDGSLVILMVVLVPPVIAVIRLCLFTA